MLYNALSMGKKNQKIVNSLRDCVTPPEEDRAMAIGNMHKKLGDMLADRQTHIETHRRAHYNTSPPRL